MINFLRGLIPGDNIVWQADNIEDYKLFVDPYCKHALKFGQKLIYFRFSKYPPLIPKDIEAETHTLRPENGFEMFINEIHSVIENNGMGGYYVFDNMSDLAEDWFSDQMLGNFFMLTCPYLLDVEALAYFTLLKNRHSSSTLSTILNTTQLFLDIYRHNNNIYIHPIKAQQRYSPTMHFLHEWKNNEFIPVTESAIISEIRSSRPYLNRETDSKKFDFWNKIFIEAENIIQKNQEEEKKSKKEKEVFNNLLKMIITRDPKILKLAEKYFTLSDIVSIRKRMIGSGLIGGKSVGMLLARAILKKENKKWEEILEVHDSFFIGSDVFYTYLIRNGCWWVRRQKNLVVYLHNAMHARRLILTGEFPENIIKQFSDMLDYFGQSPIIVRSSSLLEDNYGNAFSGKYESVFCPNQGSRDKCLKDFMSAIKTIYASTMSEKALRYRDRCKILEKDEQMSLLVQRVSGNLNSNIFYPLVAGVAYSFNPYVWHKDIDPSSGVLRLVFGMGTRAVDRSDDDYTRIVALNNPEIRPESSSNELRKFSQKKVDVIDLEANQLVSMDFEEVAGRSLYEKIKMAVSHDQSMEHNSDISKSPLSYLITFNNLLKETNFINDMLQILQLTQAGYNHPVDIEFTANFVDDNKYKINIVQCRPFQVKDKGIIKKPNMIINKRNIIFKSNGPIIGQSREAVIDRIVYVIPQAYADLTISEKYSVARLIGKITNNKENSNPDQNILLIGPGRWGTTTPSLGVPVSFSEISKVSFICEIVAMRDDLIPDVSLGTHFFNDLVDLDILYMALYPDKKGSELNIDILEKSPSKLSKIITDFDKYNNVIRIIDTHENKNIKSILLYADSIKQEVICYLEHDQ